MSNPMIPSILSLFQAHILCEFAREEKRRGSLWSRFDLAQAPTLSRLTAAVSQLNWRRMVKIVHLGRLLSIALIVAMSGVHVAFAKQPCHEPAPFMWVAMDMDECCNHTAASACAKRCEDMPTTTGAPRLEIPPAVVADAATLPHAAPARDPAAVRCRSVGTIPRLSKSLLFCSWLS